MEEILMELRLEYLPLATLMERMWADNPKEHNVGLLHSSFSRFGFASVVTINEETGGLIAGHGRLKTLWQMRVRGEEPPRYVRIGDDGQWLVPVLRGVRLSELEGRAFAIADNQTVVGSAFVLAEMWDEDALAKVLGELVDLGLEGTGFDAEDLQAQLDRQAYLARTDFEQLTSQRRESSGRPAQPAVSAVPRPPASSVVEDEPGVVQMTQMEKGWWVTCPHCSERFLVRAKK